MTTKRQKTARGDVASAVPSLELRRRHDSRVGGPPRPTPSGWSRHLEGWQLGALTVFLAASSAALVVPRSVDALELPMPSVEPRKLAAVRAEDARLVRLAVAGLPYDVRHLGGAIRAFGRAEQARDEGGVGAARRDAGNRLLAAMRDGAENVAALRAFQLDVFLRELRAYLSTGKQSDELHEVAGSFADQAREVGWLREDGPRRTILFDDGALRALYKRRWNQIVGLEGDALAPSDDEKRTLYAALLRYPVVSLPDVPAPPRERERARATLADEYRLRKVDELAKVDPSYPREIARGVLFFRLGRFGLAVESFRRHTEAFPDGPLALRATNYLRTALEHAPAELR